MVPERMFPSSSMAPCHCSVLPRSVEELGSLHNEFWLRAAREPASGELIAVALQKVFLLLHNLHL